MGTKLYEGSIVLHPHCSKHNWCNGQVCFHSSWCWAASYDPQAPYKTKKLISYQRLYAGGSWKSMEKSLSVRLQTRFMWLRNLSFVWLCTDHQHTRKVLFRHRLVGPWCNFFRGLDMKHYLVARNIYVFFICCRFHKIPKRNDACVVFAYFLWAVGLRHVEKLWQEEVLA